jgi:hypothetical protein
MSKLIPRLLLLLSTTVICQMAYAEYNAVNDTGMGILSTSGDCNSLIRPIDAYVTFFGDRGGAGAAIIIKADIRNLAYDKKINIRHSNGQNADAVVSSNPMPVNISYDGESNGYDRVSIQDQMTSGQGETLQLTLDMGGTKTICFITIGKK